MRMARALAALLFAASLGACAATPAYELGTAPPRHRLSPVQQRAQYPIEIYDPLEGANRALYKFNAQFDRYVFLPLVHAYEFVTPDFIERRVTAFFSNLTEFRNATNGLLQGRPEIAGRAATRFLLNSTAGVLGLFDVATRLGVAQQPEDFGQTLGRWGVGNGPYLIVPVLGPSNTRDFGGFVTDSLIATYLPPQSFITDWVYFNPMMYVLYAVDLRRNISFRYYGSGSPFEYDLVRFLYTKKRELEIRQ
ncbi:VacJ family lipoprotein [Benzoatithermus flavus]|uniref:VacJ family lipoprotein n=1 Tax=Benzoatithermus flavus TaxID=3108223 RepID=A0ABU8XSS3_9PROT